MLSEFYIISWKCSPVSSELCGRKQNYIFILIRWIFNSTAVLWALLESEPPQGTQILWEQILSLQEVQPQNSPAEVNLMASAY